MSEKSVGGQEAFVLPFAFGKAAWEISMIVSISMARMLQIALQSTETALSKYIELTEQEIKRGQRRETVKVE
jgi:hypothetical protein